MGIDARDDVNGAGIRIHGNKYGGLSSRKLSVTCDSTLPPLGEFANVNTKCQPGDLSSQLD
jgi:hypothetical protein